MDRELLIDALRGVYDPCCADRGVSIVDMGVVEDVRHARYLQLLLHPAPDHDRDGRGHGVALRHTIAMTSS